MNKTSVAVVLGPDSTEEQVRSIASTVEGLGLSVDRVVPMANAIYGSVDRDQIGSIRDLPEVVQVRETGDIQLPPFDPSIPQ
jgi:seryl-tRNA(Sec) selenium transferase